MSVGAGGERVRVLVVCEDDKERLRAVSALQLDPETVVVEASSGDEARDLLLQRGEVFDVIVVDGDLRPRGGYALLYDLRSRADLDGVAPVRSVVLAAREQDRWLAAWAGASDLMLKPVDPFELRRRLPGALEGDPPPYGDAGSTRSQVGSAVASHD